MKVSPVLSHEVVEAAVALRNDKERDENDVRILRIGEEAYRWDVELWLDHCYTQEERDASTSVANEAARKVDWYNLELRINELKARERRILLPIYKGRGKIYSEVKKRLRVTSERIRIEIDAGERFAPDALLAKHLYYCAVKDSIEVELRKRTAKYDRQLSRTLEVFRRAKRELLVKAFSRLTDSEKLFLYLHMDQLIDESLPGFAEFHKGLLRRKRRLNGVEKRMEKSVAKEQPKLIGEAD